jgi:hypothetical protein
MTATLPTKRTLDQRAFLLFWALAALTYGAGDMLTTLAITAHPLVTEANVLIETLMANFGQGGLVAAKLAVFGGSLLLCIQPFSEERDPFLYLAPPVILSVFGAFITTYNVVLLLQ